MSLASEQSSQSLVTSVFLDSCSSPAALSQALLELSQCPYVYSGELDTATATITHSVVKNLGTTSCQIWLYDNSRKTLRQIAQYCVHFSHKQIHALEVDSYPDYFQALSERSWLLLHTQSNSLISESSIQSPSGCRIDNGREDIPPYLDATGVTALIELPIYQHNQIIGVLCCAQYHSPRIWQSAEKDFLITAACLVGLAISQTKHQQLEQILNNQKRQLSLETIERKQAEQAWYESQQFIQGVLDASTNILYINDFATGRNHYVNGYMKNILGYSPEEIQLLGVKFLEQLVHPKDIQAIQRARQHLAKSQSGDIVETEYRLRHKKGGWHWMLCRETIFQWNQDNTPRQLLGTATDITVHKKNAEALQQKNQELTALARVDALTQIANRRAFDEFLENAWGARNHTPLTLILCDIDYFKRYNDTYGHQAGDECLRLVAQALCKAVKRRPDLVARYGGEEFAAILPNTALAGAQRVAQNIQIAVRELDIENRLSEIGNRLTVSLGVATVASTLDGSPEELIAAADRGLYRAKSDGRAQFAVGYIES